MQVETVISNRCPVCKKTHAVDVGDIRAYSAWVDGGILIQDAMPYLTATEREQLISHLCPQCQKKIFG